ncbi:hypothetical protein H8E88_31430 [candidate division KSB1 bacterium]|nr:hypothetical protein [candidate division KSB1 bacterium]MBL7095097.1 hypothetical protein [candidate division KSB1 bacterium]
MNSKKRWIRGTIVFHVLLCYSLAQGTIINGGHGMTHVKSALNLKSGHLSLYARSQAYGKIVQSPPSAIWDVQGAFSLNVGISDHIELAISPVVYQDTNKGKTGYNLPDDLFIGLKFGSHIFRGSSMVWGISLDTRLPTGEYHNIALEPYSAGKVAWGFTGILSYVKYLDYAEESLSIDFNLGYLNHNDVDQKLTGLDDDPSPVKYFSQEFRYGIGIKIPTSTFDFSFELFGNTFFQQPPETAYSLENFIYFTPTITYKATRWLSICAGSDFRISQDKDETSYEFVQKSVRAELPNYPDWRIRLGFKFLILPIKNHSVSNKEILIRRADSRKKLFEEIIREQQEAESTEEELDKIKTERIKAEKEIERLRRLLEQDQKKKEPEKKKKPEQPPPK